MVAANEDVERAQVSSRRPTSPSIFEVASNMTVGCMAIFILADLRKLARRGSLLVDAGADINDNELMLQLPFKGGEVIPGVWSRNKETIRRKMKTNPYNTLKYLIERWTNEQEAYPQLWNTHCQYVGDEKASQECVYSIHTNATRKRIIVVFRGSITLKDWFQDSKGAFGEVKNPLYGMDLPSPPSPGENNTCTDVIDDQPDMLPLHLGFKEYLYGTHLPLLPVTLFQDVSSHLPDIQLPSPNLPEVLPSPPNIPMTESFGAKSDKHSDDNEPSDAQNASASSRKCEENDENNEKEKEPADESTGKEESIRRTKIDIILDQISSVYESRPDYQLYFTGHSLGGALALIASIEACVRFTVKEKRSPVTCVTVGNPKAGGNVLRQVVRSLECQRHLRILGIHRVDDLVPLLPGKIFCNCSVVNTFCQVGFQLKLERGIRYTLRYLGTEEDSLLKDMREKCQQLRLILPCMHRVGDRHFYKTYLDDLVSRKEVLGVMSLDDAYASDVYCGST